MAQVITNSGHDDMIHDATLDYYGRRLATCSSDKSIKIFEVEGDSHRLLETLKGYGPRFTSFTPSLTLPHTKSYCFSKDTREQYGVLRGHILNSEQS
ncbi:protein transporter SEC13 [Emergomyces africanus]|uniref:Protein transporter SEC13 n=1 Tax=Emergomyces africanus TaxID=1955775 RepID=A0A1B7P605_9EURO|nr:protein transporter SEC13 [Emergomyces africanus]